MLLSQRLCEQKQTPVTKMFIKQIFELIIKGDKNEKDNYSTRVCIRIIR